MDNNSDAITVGEYERSVSTRRMLRLFLIVVPSAIMTLSGVEFWRLYRHYCQSATATAIDTSRTYDDNDDAVDPLVIVGITGVIAMTIFRWNMITAYAATIVRLGTGGWVDDLGRKRPTKPIRLYDIELDPYCRYVERIVTVWCNTTYMHSSGY
jgi:hypothetical protein